MSITYVTAPKSLKAVAKERVGSLQDLLRDLPEFKDGEEDLSGRDRQKVEALLARLELWAEETERQIRQYDTGAANRLSISLRSGGDTNLHEEFIRRTTHYVTRLEAIGKHPEYATKLPNPEPAPGAFVDESRPPRVVVPDTVFGILRELKTGQLWALIIGVISSLLGAYGFGHWSAGLVAAKADVVHERQLQAMTVQVGECQQDLATTQQRIKSVLDEAAKPKK